MKNKKSIYNLGIFLIIAIVLTIVFSYLYIFIYEANTTYVIEKIFNISSNFYAKGDIDSKMHNHITNTYNNYNSFNIMPDMITLLLIGMIYLQALGVAIVSKKQRNAEFFANLTIINMFLMFIMSIVSGVLQWFWSEFYTNTLLDLHYSTRFVEFIISNSSILFFFMFVSLVFINKIEFFGRKKKETTEFEDIEQELSDAEEVDFENED